MLSNFRPAWISIGLRWKCDHLSNCRCCWSNRYDFLGATFCSFWTSSVASVWPQHTSKWSCCCVSLVHEEKVAKLIWFWSIDWTLKITAVGTILVTFGFFVVNSGADQRITGKAYGDRVGHGLINTLLSGASSGATFYLLQRVIEGKFDEFSWCKRNDCRKCRFLSSNSNQRTSSSSETPRLLVNRERDYLWNGRCCCWCSRL